MADIRDSTFYGLPESLVDELLSNCGAVSESLSRSFRSLVDRKELYRKELNDLGVLHRDSDISSVPTNPTCCGIDGAYAVERLLSTDLGVTAAVAVEGLTPPMERRFWPLPRHFSVMKALPHYDSTGVMLRAIMMSMEVRLATNAPHEVVLLDGSMTTPLIYVNQALGEEEESPPELYEVLESNLRDTVESVKTIIQSERSDKIFTSVPKYTTRREISVMLGEPGYEDRGLLSFLLRAGEYVGPISRAVESRPRYIERVPEYSDFVNFYMEKIAWLKVIYYRPYQHVPVLRLEVSSSVAQSPQRLAMLLEAVRIQCGAPSIFEPYPLYMADRMVKHLGRALPALRQTTTQFIAEDWEDDLGTTLLAMHGYRTESGRG